MADSNNPWANNPWAKGGEYYNKSAVGQGTDYLPDGFLDTTESIQEWKENKQSDNAKNKPSGIIGEDEERVIITLSSDKKSFTISENAGKDTVDFIKRIALTPFGVESVNKLIKIRDKIYIEKKEIIYDETGDKIHDSTTPYTKDGTRLENEMDDRFDYYIIRYTTNDTLSNDRMVGWSDEMKINVIGVHEIAHFSRLGLTDKFHDKGDTYVAELTSAFQFYHLFPNATKNMNWVQNYIENFGNRKIVDKAYKNAINGLIKSNDLSKKTGKDMINKFVNRKFNE